MPFGGAKKKELKTQMSEWRTGSSFLTVTTFATKWDSPSTETTNEFEYDVVKGENLKCYGSQTSHQSGGSPQN